MIITPSARASFKTMIDTRVGGHEVVDDTTSIASGISTASQGVLAGNIYRVGGLTRELVEKLQESEREGSLAALPPNIDYIELKPGDAPPKGFAWEASSKKKGDISLISLFNLFYYNYLVDTNINHNCRYYIMECYYKIIDGLHISSFDLLISSSGGSMEGSIGGNCQ